jgi:heme-degrading monooxygenase HmoA
MPVFRSRPCHRILTVEITFVFGAVMIRVLIERNVAPGLEDYYDATIKRTVSSVTKAPGCLSGESLKDPQNPRRRIVMSKWQSREDWDHWYFSDERRQVISEITPMLEGSEKVTLLELTH